MDTNANLSSFSIGCDSIGRGDRENGGQGQESRNDDLESSRRGAHENGGHEAECNEQETRPHRYQFALYPNKDQEAALERQTVLTARLWNAALEQRETQWRHECQRKKGAWKHNGSVWSKSERKGISRFDQQRELKTIRADDPEYASMSSSSLELTLKALDLAFNAFYRRAKAGDGKSSGYPRYKASKRPDMPWRFFDHGTIWYRDGSGWKFEGSGKKWKLYAKGVPGKIRARGEFPTGDLEYRTMEIMRRNDRWEASIVVKFPDRRHKVRAGASTQLIYNEEFSWEIHEDGRCQSGWTAENASANERNAPGYHGVTNSSDGVTPKTGADDRIELASHSGPADGVTPKTGAGDRMCRRQAIGFPDGVTPKTGAGDRSDFQQIERQEDGVTPKTGAGDRDDVFHAQPGRDGVTPKTGTGAKGVSDHQKIDALKAERDTRFVKFSYRWRRWTKRIARLEAKQARRRREELHRMTTRIVSRSRSVEVVCPPVRESTRSARGTEKDSGAAVKPVAALNRHVLSQAPAAVIEMLSYKSEESGIPFARVTPDEHAIAVGRDLPVAAKAARKARRKLKKDEVK